MGSSTMTAKELYHIQFQSDHGYESQVLEEHTKNAMRSLMRTFIVQVSPLLPLTLASK
jgi:hypothetical protein